MLLSVAPQGIIGSRPRQRQTRREAGAQSPRASIWWWRWPGSRREMVLLERPLTLTLISAELLCVLLWALTGAVVVCALALALALALGLGAIFVACFSDR